MSLYSKCVIEKSDSIDKGSCEKEFRNLMECFKKVEQLFIDF